MEETLEFVCEGVPKKSATAFFMHLLSNSGEVDTFECTEDISEGKVGRREMLDAAVLADVDLSVMANVRGLRIGTVMLPDAFLRMVKYDDRFDVDCSFDAEAIRGRVPELHAAVLSLAEQFEAETCFAGLEPAADSDTRLFTDREIGSFRLD